MTSIEPLRILFETWASNDGAWPKAVARDNRGNYLLIHTAASWRAWQACAQALSDSAPQKLEQPCD